MTNELPQRREFIDKGVVVPRRVPLGVPRREIGKYLQCLPIHCLSAALVALVLEKPSEFETKFAVVRLQAYGFAVCRFCCGEIALSLYQAAERAVALAISPLKLESLLQHLFRPFRSNMLPAKDE